MNRESLAETQARIYGAILHRRQEPPVVSRNRSARANACWPILLLASSVPCATVASQTSFVDDAGRRVELPARVDRVFSAGAPAEVLLYTLVPEKLAGRNMQPPAAALELTPPRFRAMPAIVNLPDRDDPRYDAELLNLDVDVYIDYGTVDDDYVAALEAISDRTHIPGIILDGSLAMIPDVYRRLGAALGVAPRGTQLANEAQRIIDKYRGTLSAASTRVYLACSQNGLSPCYRGHSAGEAAELLGTTNVAGSLVEARRRPLTPDEIRGLKPAVIIAASQDNAAAIRVDAAWRDIDAVAAGRVHAPPTLPFNWGPRPPSVNRLAGMIWLAYVLPGRELDAAFFDDVRRFFATFYHVTPSDEQLRALIQELR
jgi:iron complex transport system substrate-binding protein